MWNELMGDETPKNRHKLYIKIGILAILLVLIPLGVYLVRQTQIFRPKAVDEQINPETSFSLEGPLEQVICVRAPCPPVPVSTLNIGSEFEVNVLVRSDFDSANVFKANVNFPKDLLEVIAIDTPIITNPPICGGIAGLSCPSGYYCRMSEPANMPDQSGVCLPEDQITCNTSARESGCPRGYSCEQYCPPGSGDCSLTAGVCKAISSEPQACGGYPDENGNSPTCPQGYTCDYSGNDEQVADQMGVCIPSDTAPKSCSGPTDNSCPANYTCYQDCGPPVVRGGDPEPGYTCLSQAQIASREVSGCPICLSSSTKISTPKGSVYVSELKEGMEVYSQDKSGKQTIAKILKTSSVKAPLTHKVVHLSLKDGRNAYISPNHPTISGVTVGELKAGDSYDGSVVKSAELVPYTRGRTYDLLPEGETGFYYADGVLMASTLKGSVKGLTANAQNTESSCREDAQCAEGFYCKSRTRCRTLPDGTAQCTNVIGGDCYPKPSEGECAQVITRACSNTAPQVCRDFPTPCDVPDGWVVPGLNSRNSNYFIVDWVQKSFDNGAGTITLNGKSQGTKTNLTPLTMVTIKFKAKKAGTGTISFGDSTQILRLSDSQNILQTKRNLEFTVAGATPSASVIGDPCGPGGIAPCPSASASPLAGTCHTTPDCSANQYCQYVEAECSVGNCPRYGYCVANNGGKGDANNDGFIDLADLSILYSSFLKNVAKLDFNNDNKINSIDFGYMILLLRSLRVIN